MRRPVSQAESEAVRAAAAADRTAEELLAAIRAAGLTRWDSLEAFRQYLRAWGLPFRRVHRGGRRTVPGGRHPGSRTPGAARSSPCLGCDLPFPSRGIANRFCDACKREWAGVDQTMTFEYGGTDRVPGGPRKGGPAPV